MTPVYIDYNGHLWSADRATLHAFADGIGMLRSWYQDRPVLYHYDVMSYRYRARAIAHGAIRITSRDMVRLMREAVA